MKRNLVLIVLLIAGYNAFSQTSWERLYSKESTDVFRCVQEVTTGSGYVIAGYTANTSANDTDAYVVRLNLTGDTIWTFSYNGLLSKKDLFYKIIQTSDGGFIACGYTNSVTGLSDDFLFVKISSAGQNEWTKTYGGSGKERAQDIVETTDGFTIAGYTNGSGSQYYDAIIVHTDLVGNTLWTKTIGDANYDDANSIEQLADGGYILGGQSNNGGNGLDQFLIRTNVNGDTLWTKRFGTIATDNIESITLVSDGFILAGSANTVSSGDDGYLVKTDTSGNVLWTKTFGGSDQDDFHRVEKTADDGFILCGTTSSSGALNPNMWLVKTNATGDSTWAVTFGGDNHDHGYSAIQTSDGGYLIAGHSGSFGFNNEDGYAVKVGGNGTGTNHLTYITAYSLSSPLCSGTASVVKVVIRNFGNVPVSNIHATVEISGSITQTLNATYSGTLAAHDLTTLTFSPAINTTVGGTLTFNGYVTGISNSVFPENNSFSKTVNLVPCTGIEDVQLELGYSFYPNPTNGNVVFDFSVQYSKAKIELMNATGAIVKSISLNNTFGLKKSVDLSAFAKGLYFVKVSTEEGFDVRRLILE